MNKEEREIINKLYSDITSFDVPCMPDITISRRYLKIILSLCLKQQETIDKAIEWVKDWMQVKNDWFEEDSKPSELLDILKEASE